GYGRRAAPNDRETHGTIPVPARTGGALPAARPSGGATSRLRRPQHAVERSPGEHIRPDVVEVEVDLAGKADAALAPLVRGIEGVTVDRDHRLESELDVPAEPDHPRVDAAGRPAPPLDGGLDGKLDDRDHPVERRWQADVLHERLEIL